MSTSAVCMLALALCGSLTALEKSWSFDGEKAGAAPEGFSVEAGAWSVKAGEAPGKNALAQTAKSGGSVFNLIVARELLLKDVDVSVKFKALAGDEDQGGGIVWRVKDAQNYYVARYNPLESNFRLYHVVKGRRSQLEGAENLALGAGWHTLRVTMSGDKIECYLDDKKHLEATDGTFREAGSIGLWTKADAQTLFDDLKVSGN